MGIECGVILRIILGVGVEQPRVLCLSGKLNCRDVLYTVGVPFFVVMHIIVTSITIDNSGHLNEEVKFFYLLLTLTLHATHFE